MNIPFNIPYTTGKELGFVEEAICSGHLSGNGSFTKLCHQYFEDVWSVKKALLTSSGTDALEMASLLINIKPGDEVIVPSYTFVSTALAFARQGAIIIFADSRDDNPCIDETKIENLISEKTKAIVPVHYNGISCEMDRLMELANKYNLYVVEDAAHAFGASYKGKPLGTIGHLGCFSFHETKILQCGEGGMLAINDSGFNERAEIIWEKGTNRCNYHRGNIKRYEWLDTGSSFLMSDISAAFLYAQVSEFSEIFNRRKIQWQLYFSSLEELAGKGFLKLPVIPENTQTNSSGFYLLLRNHAEREELQNYLNKEGIQALTHYLDLSQSPYIIDNQSSNKDNRSVMSFSRMYQDTLLRLPLYHNLTSEQIFNISSLIKDFYSVKDQNDLI